MPADPVIAKPVSRGSMTVAIVASRLVSAAMHTSSRASVPRAISRATLAMAPKARCISSSSSDLLRASAAWWRMFMTDR